MRELESSLQQFGEFLLKAQLVRPAAAPYFVRWVRRFLSPQPRTNPSRIRCGVSAKNWRRTAAPKTGRCVRRIRRSVSTSSTSSSEPSGIASRPARSWTSKATQAHWPRSSNCARACERATIPTEPNARTSTGSDGSWSTARSSRACPSRA